MARSFKVYLGEDETPVYDLTDATSNVHVVWEEIEAGGRAFKGESTQNSIPIRDEQGETGEDSDLPGGLSYLGLPRGSRWEWLDGSDGSEVRMAAGRIGPKDYSRGRQKADRAREIVMQGADRNEELRNIIVDNESRDEETDVVRVEWLRTTYLSGSPRPTTNIADTYISSANPVTMPAALYDGTNPAEILEGIAGYANKNFFVTVDDELFYDDYDSTAYLSGLRISDRPDEVTTGESGTQPSTFRIYPGAGPNGLGVAADSIWENDPNSGTWNDTATSTPSNSVDNGTSSASTGTGGIDVKLGQFAYGPLSSDEAALLAAGGGVLRAQFLARSRSGLGINESQQHNISQITARVTEGATATIRGTAYAGHNLGSTAGCTEWIPDTGGRNASFPPAAADNTLTAVSGTVAGDYLVIEVGYRSFSGSTTGGTLFVKDTAASDLPLDDSSVVGNLNSWIQFGAPEEALPVYPPKWDVGPASTEDGIELLSGLRLYYGQNGQYVYVSHAGTAADYWHSEKSLYTTDPAIADSTAATVLAESILFRSRLEERTYSVSIGPLPIEHIGLIKPGQLIDIKARAIPDADDQFVSRRIAQLKWTTPRAGVFWAHMQLDRPVKEAPNGVGPKQASEAINAHTDQGAAAHPELLTRDVLTTLGDLPYRGASDWTRLPIGSAGQVVTVTGGVPVWEDPTSALTVEEEDGTPTGTPDTLKFPNGRLTDNGDGTFSVAFPSGGTVTVEEADGTPTGSFDTIKFPNGTLTDNGDGSVTYTPAGGGGVSWELEVDEDGSSFANFTAITGTWSSNGTIIQQTGTPSAATKQARYNNIVPLGWGLIVQSDIRLPSAGQGVGANIQAKLVIGTPSTGAGNGLAVVVDDGTNNVQLERYALATIGSYVQSINQDQWYTVRLVVANRWASIYVDGVLVGSGPADVTALGEYFILSTFRALVDFRNIKIWTLSGGAP